MSTGTSPLPAVQLVGAVLNRRYRLTRPLGQGGMGVVYAGAVEGTAQSVAIKLLRPEYLDDPAIVARFQEEAHIAARIVHPNVLRVFDVQRAEDGTPYLVMELLDGQPLASLLKAQSRLPVAQAASILQGALAGLGAAHGLGVVHRDLKPENVYLAHQAGAPGGIVVKLLDFGIAKVMDAAGGMGNQTKTGMLLGTPAYMSPEQIKNSKDVDARTDLWSAGVLFYEMITGRQAFPAPTEFARLAAVLGTQPDPIVGVDPTLAPWAHFVERAMHKDRTLRFQSAAEMSHALAAIGAASTLGGGAQSRIPATPVVMPAPPRDSSMPPPPVMPIQGVMTPGLESTKPSQGHSPSLPPGGTLASPSNQRRSVTPEPQVVLVNQGDADARSFRDEEPRRGVAPLIVAILVVLALGAGFLLGYAVAKSG